jgi:dolichol-phosphate mannosyltransferase
MLSLIIPTYNESQSIKTTIKEQLRILKKAKIPFEIIVADDNSPDNTANIVKKAFKKESVKVLLRKKNKGLSPAVIEGFSIAKGNILAVMDGDGQHDPNILPKMYKLIKNKDLVVATRYAKGGSVGEWNTSRTAISKFASLLAKPFLLKNPVSDPMAGFFMLKKELFMKSKKELQSKGYKILLDLLFVNYNNKLSIAEVPYTFRKREEGESKLGLKVSIQYILMLVKEAYRRHKEFVFFGIVGGLGTIVNLLMLYLGIEFLGFVELIASIVAIEISIIHNFFLNNFWTFKKRKHKKNFLERFLWFQFGSLATMSINAIVFYIGFSLLGIHYLIAQLIGIIIAFLLNFLLSSKIIFKKE